MAKAAVPSPVIRPEGRRADRLYPKKAEKPASRPGQPQPRGGTSGLARHLAFA